MFPKDTVLISLDRMLAAAEDQESQGQQMALKTDPPKIFVCTTPAILLLVDGTPVRAPIPQTSLEVIANANWDLFFDKGGNKYYLSYSPLWLQSSSLNGPWTIAKSLPADMSKLPDEWADVRKTIPPSVPASVQVPTVFSYDKAAELIVFDGKPEWKAISNTNLAYAANTDSDFFIDYSTNRFYYLTSGRWFSSLQQTGPWTFASDKLPPDFAAIPSDSPAADVLPSVPGTDQAREAVMMAQIPTLATVNKTEAAVAVKVNYQGEPQFQPIANTQLTYAVNTDNKVIKVGDLYYLCFQGVWFMSRGVNGPWETASSVPAAIYQIPPSSPVYNVTYVKVYESTPDTVTCGYTAGYMGTFVLGMAVGAAIAYGTGYYYPPHVYWGPHPVPYYVGYPRTYGVGYHYNYYNGGYYAQQSVYGPYGAASRAAWYNPSTGFYGRAASVQTIAGGGTVGQAYNPWTGTYAATRQGNNAYSQWAVPLPCVEINGLRQHTALIQTEQSPVAARRKAAELWARWDAMAQALLGKIRTTMFMLAETAISTRKTLAEIGRNTRTGDGPAYPRQLRHTRRRRMRRRVLQIHITPLRRLREQKRDQPQCQRAHQERHNIHRRKRDRRPSLTPRLSRSRRPGRSSNLTAIPPRVREAPNRLSNTNSTARIRLRLLRPVQDSRDVYVVDVSNSMHRKKIRATLTKERPWPTN